MHGSIVKQVRVRKGLKLELSHINRAKLPTVAPPCGEEAGENRQTNLWQIKNKKCIVKKVIVLQCTVTVS